MTSKREKMEGLLERVRKATGPDRELDVDLAWSLEPERYRAAYWNGRVGKPGTTLPLKLDGLGRISVQANCPAFTASVDAALALVERRLPEANAIGIETEKPGSWCAYVSRNFVKDGHWYYEATHTSRPLAILTALLTALQNTEGDA